MPHLRVGARHWPVSAGDGLLDALIQAGISIPYSCRAGSCHACLVRCTRGEALDAQPEALAAERRQQGWRLACQCRVVEDLDLEVFDPLHDGLPAQVVAADWLGAQVLRLRLQAERPQRYRAGQHQVLWTESGVARPYSLASLPGCDDFLEFHIDCRLPGAFCDVARNLRAGDRLRLGELRGGALHYDPDWQARPLLLLAAGTGLGPLWGVLRQALHEGHQGPIHILHLAHEAAGHYLADELARLSGEHAALHVRLVTPPALREALGELRLLARQAVALACGSPDSVETFAKSLYLAGVPRNRVLTDMFLGSRPAGI
ncbi:iron-sulfur-binding ferredoxin reductase [Pseudomonas sp. DTU_2021_1001937_2_SI_NGA_ILE_001]|uniref:iron-sulfur-binding ferredoxin reductase n=1 Tax=Pseudomonas sp. DTU_2021_1001937_2_SI_NGA_ILE_001 TaxID=3077589 RepID=UPI0028FC2732|nr:iron-sulfur-binding ferredoxin reductase [Pseudomonas sp. DTU_2021_1001937_2_SI_NGA_ILE_001]WNW11643.1 iron-sulfur-binding ferredoxin reductase [Pseudomonas sp. DTU_2021_1001937_2_SI_NGA_ILE_001]